MVKESLEYTPFLPLSLSLCPYCPLVVITTGGNGRLQKAKLPKEEKFSWFIVCYLTLTWEILSYCISNISFVPISLFFLLLVFPLQINYTLHSCSTVLGYRVVFLFFFFVSPTVSILFPFWFSRILLVCPPVYRFFLWPFQFINKPIKNILHFSYRVFVCLFFNSLTFSLLFFHRAPFLCLNFPSGLACCVHYPLESLIY